MTGHGVPAGDRGRVERWQAQREPTYTGGVTFRTPTATRRALLALAASMLPLHGARAAGRLDLTPPPFEELLRLAKQSGCSPSDSSLAEVLGAPSTCALLRDAPASSSREDLVRLLQRGQSLSRAAASKLLDAELTGDWLLHGRAPGPPADARIAELYAAAARAAPLSVAPLAAFVERASEREDALLRVLDASPTPVLQAGRLLARLEAGAHEGQGPLRLVPVLRAFLLVRGGTVPDASVDLIDRRGHDELVVDLEVLERLRARGVPGPQLVPWAARVLRGAVDHSLPELAERALRTAPAGVRAAAIELAATSLADPAADAPSTAGEEQGGDPEWYYDARLDLAAVLVESGALDDARKVVAAARHPSEPKVEPGAERVGYAGHPADRVRRAILAWHLEGVGPEDPFDVAVDLQLQRGSYDLAVLATPLLGARYPEALRFGLGLEFESDARHEAGYGPGLAIRTLLPRPVQRLQALRAQGRQRARRALASLAPAPRAAARPRNPVSATVARMLNDSPAAVWTERPLARGVQPFVPAKEPPGRDGPPAGVVLPPGFGLVRLQQAGESAAALALSQKLDPTGEVSGGAYWLLTSKDGGRSWSELYTGLRHLRPYEATPRSEVDLLEGDEIRIEVVVREIDEAAITFPPIFMRPKREKGSVLLTARVQDLLRDSDGDGLTDLVERRLLIDPKNRDTDGDGIDDGSDPFPQLATGASAPGPLEQLLSTIADELGPHGSADGSAERAPESLTVPGRVRATIFVQGSRSDFEGVRVPARVIVLEPGEHERSVRRFGEFYPFRIRMLLWNAKRDRVYLKWDAHWRGGSRVLRLDRGQWITIVSSEWIT